MNKLPPPDGYGRGSFFVQTKRYRSPEDLQNAADHLHYLREIMRDQIESTPEDEGKPERCETHDDHEFNEDVPWLHSMQCIRCGRIFEHPARFIFEQDQNG